MKITMVGLGTVGKAIAMRLSEEGHDITAVDIDENRIEEIAGSVDIMTITGNGMDHYILEEAGTADADLFIAVTDDDAMNMLCCLMAKKLGVKHAIARVRTVEYYRQMVFLKEELGISLFFNPENETAIEISRILRYPSAAKVDSFAKGKAEIVEFVISHGMELENMPLTMLNKPSSKSRILICLVKRGEEIIIPKGTTVLMAGDIAYVVGATDGVHEFIKTYGIYKRKIKDVLLLGGGRISLYLGKLLLQSGIRVKIIERVPEHCEIIKDILPKSQVILGEGADPDLLLEEGIGNTDAFVALSGSDQDNIISSIYAKKVSGCKVITKLKDSRYRSMFDVSELDSVIMPTSVAADFVSSYVRGVAESISSADIMALHKIADGKAEVLEFKIVEDSLHLGKPLSELKIRKKVIIGSIIRADKCIIPGGSDSIKRGDTVIVVSGSTEVRKFEDIFYE
ncbi:MAG: Trk system potassium transporter TrkA [Candidatus Scatomorpha sp.]|jgi:trk system potassium uptake protein TrkA